jgi:cell division protein FtsL
MTDWADGIEIRNNGIKCVLDFRTRSECLRTLLSLGLIAGALLFFSWVRSEITYTGYETQKLVEAEEVLLSTREKLITEEELLTSPARIEMIATQNLGMTMLRPNQLIIPPIPVQDGSSFDSLAMAESEADELKQSEENKRFEDYSSN